MLREPLIWCYGNEELSKKKMVLGKTQKSIYAYVVEHPGCRAIQVGEALYDMTSSCAHPAAHENSKTTKAHWARRVLNGLVSRKLLVTEAGEYWISR